MTFEDFVKEQGPALLRLAFVLTGDRDFAQDLTQIALADVYRHWRKVSAARSPEAYTRRVLINAHLSWRRRRWTREAPVEVKDTDIPAVGDHADDIAARHDLRARVAALPPRARTVLVLRYWADLDDRAIAEAMGTSESTVRATAARAVAALRTATSTTLKETS